MDKKLVNSSIQRVLVIRLSVQVEISMIIVGLVVFINFFLLFIIIYIFFILFNNDEGIESLEVFKVRLDRTLDILIWWKLSLTMVGRLDYVIFKGSFHPKSFCASTSLFNALIKH